MACDARPLHVVFELGQITSARLASMARSDHVFGLSLRQSASAFRSSRTTYTPFPKTTSLILKQSSLRFAILRPHPSSSNFIIFRFCSPGPLFFDSFELLTPVHFIVNSSPTPHCARRSPHQSQQRILLALYFCRSLRMHPAFLATVSRSSHRIWLRLPLFDYD